MIALALAPGAAAAATATLSQLKWSRAYARTSQNVFATYVSSASTTVSFSIRNAAGVVVRDLGDHVPIDAGPHAVDWDGYGDDTFPVPDGSYELVIMGDDPSGLSGTTTAPILIDDYGPTFRFKTLRLHPSGHLVIRVSDSGSGVLGATLLVDKQIVARIRRRNTSFSYRPPHGWVRGRHVVTVLARDRTYNQSTITRTIVVG